MTAEVNLIAVLAAAIVNFIIGALWYSPILFGKTWVSAMGKTEEEIRASGNMTRGMVVSAGGALVTSYMLALLIQYMGLVTIGTGLVLGFIVWLGFIIPSQMSAVVYEGRNKNLALLFTTYKLVALVVTSAMLAVWQ